MESYKVESYKQERFDIFIGLVLSALGGNFDINKYEDFARTLLGGRAYLLFSFEKIVNFVILNAYLIPI